MSAGLVSNILNAIPRLFRCRIQQPTTDVAAAAAEAKEEKNGTIERWKTLDQVELVAVVVVSYLELSSFSYFSPRLAPPVGFNQFSSVQFNSIEKVTLSTVVVAVEWW